MRTQTQLGQWRRTRGARHQGRPPSRATAKSAGAPAPAAAPVPAARFLAADRRLRSAARPEDSALYFCSCGHDFRAGVSTTVACPSCGVGQAW